MEKHVDRRNFLRNSLAAGSGLVLANAFSPLAPTATGSPLPGSPTDIPMKPLERVRVGFVGVGGRGTDLLQVLLNVEGAEIKAVCDLQEDRVKRAQQLVTRAGGAQPEGYSKGETDYQNLCSRNDLDLVINATPWQKHNAINVFALNAGKHVATEVPAALTVAECWQQVEASEKNQKHCIILENYCYQRDVMLLVNMLRQGLFGEVMHAEGGYQKDARYYDIQFDAKGDLTWQGQFRKGQKGNMYPTHDIGPIAHWLDINRGDRFEYLVSMGSNAYSFNDYGKENLGPDHFLTKTKFDMSDINVSLIHTAKGRTIYLIFDTLLSRPEPRNVYRLLGTKGIYDRTTGNLYAEGVSKTIDKKHGVGQWDSLDKLYDRYEHPLWKALGEKAGSSGHGGGDFMMLYRLIKSFQTGSPPDINVYDAATWSAIIELSDQSARNKSKPVEFPDFTRGKWKTNAPLPLTGA